MSSRLPTDDALEKEDRIDEIKEKKKTKNKTKQKKNKQKNKKQPTHPTPALPYAKVVGRPGTGSYPAPSPDPTTHEPWNIGHTDLTFTTHKTMS